MLAELEAEGTEERPLFYYFGIGEVIATNLQLPEKENENAIPEERKRNIPTTAEEAFVQLDAMLSDEDKEVLRNSEDTFDYHFSLGLWIRNNWIYPLSDEEFRSLMKCFEKEDDDSPFGITIIHPDNESSTIIEKYVEHLKKI